jgi:hypothetical protein
MKKILTRNTVACGEARISFWRNAGGGRFHHPGPLPGTHYAFALPAMGGEGRLIHLESRCYRQPAIESDPHPPPKPRDTLPITLNVPP